MRMNSIDRWCRCSLLLLAGLVLGGQSALADHMVCAVIPAAGSNAASAAEILETQLGGTDGFRLVSRAEIQAVINEQVLSAALSAEGTQSRLQLGKLVKADLLVFINESSNKNAKSVTLTVAETRHGLRLAMEPVLWSPEKAEAICKNFAVSVQRARDLAARPDLTIVAVSPFESKDIALDNEQRRRGYARIIEQNLMQQPALAVVELLEARALGQESAISGQSITRDLPFYIFGTYKTTGNGDVRKVNITLAIQHGQQTLGETVKENVLLSDVGQALQVSTSELLARISANHVTGPPTKIESSVLMERADVFAEMNEWDQALPLYESVLLLNPKHPRAHFQIFLGRTSLMGEGTPGFMRLHRRADQKARMQHAQVALDHLEILLLQRLFSETNPNCPEHDQISFGRITSRLALFRGQFRIDPSNNEKDPEGIHEVFKDLCERQADILFRALTIDMTSTTGGDEKRGSSLTGGIVYAARTLYRVEEEEAALRTMDRLLTWLDSESHASLIVNGITGYIGSRMSDEHREAFLVRLEKSNSPNFQLAHRFGRIFQSIEDQDSLDKAKDDIKTLAEANNLIPLLKSLLLRADLVLSRQNRGIAAEAKPMVPVLKPLLLNASTLPPTSQPSQIYDWLTCENEQEVVSTERGLFRVEQGEHLIPIWNSPQRLASRDLMNCRWDGKYIWGFTKYIRGVADRKSPISVFDLETGLLAQFDESDTPAGVGMPLGELAVIEPGRSVFFGYFTPENLLRRNYAMLLSIDPRPGQNVVKHVDIIYESRQIKKSDDREPAARRPSWMLPSSNKDGTDPRVLVGGTWDAPLLLNIKARTAQDLRWPNGLVIEHKGRFYIGTGNAGMNDKQHSALYRCDNLLQKPKLLVDFGERPFTGNVYDGSPYYGSMVVFENRLHMLVSQIEFSGRSPAWTAVDLKTLKSYSLVDNFPEEFGRHKRQALRVSPRYGLILLTDGKVFRVELPPVADWPRWPTQATSKPSQSTPAEAD